MATCTAVAACSGVSACTTVGSGAVSPTYWKNALVGRWVLKATPEACELSLIAAGLSVMSTTMMTSAGASMAPSETTLDGSAVRRLRGMTAALAM